MCCNHFALKLQHYRFGEQDALLLKSIQPIIEENFQKFFDGFCEFIFEFSYIKLFISDEQSLQRYKVFIKNWVCSLFTGVYDDKYFHKLNKINEIHINVHLPVSYVNAAFSYIRISLRDILLEKNRIDALASLDKILDINFDILAINSNHQEEDKLLQDAVFVRKCVQQKSVQPYFQPIYSVQNHECVKYESLMRLIDDEKKEAVSVYPYLNVAKKTQLYKKLVAIMIEKVFETFASKDIEFSINICYDDLEDRNFCASIVKRIRNFSYPKNVIFEITETDFVKDFSTVKQFVSEIRKYGCKIAIDDFGSGFSSLENILKLKPEVIKIDGTLIKNLDTSKDAQMIVATIVHMSDGFHAKTVAEYVHSKEIKEMAVKLGVDYLQGYYLGKPREKI